MQTIKFRFYDKTWKRFYYKQLYNDRSGDTFPANEPIGKLEHPQQYTGLLDKNKKEIYVGDILEYEEPRFESEMLRSPVVFIAGSFGLLDKSQGHMTPAFYHLGSFAQQDLEIVGNIFESPVDNKPLDKG